MLKPIINNPSAESHILIIASPKNNKLELKYHFYLAVC